MALLAAQKVSLAGLDPVFVAASPTGDEFPNSGRAVLYVRNDGTSEITVTVNSQTPCNYGYDHDAVITVPPGGERVIGPFAPARFNDPNGRVQVSYSAVTSVTVAVLEV